ncbi:hypothetical protein [Methanoculleus sp.]
MQRSEDLSCPAKKQSFRIKGLAEDLGKSPIDYWMDRFVDDPIRG